jgi:CheY-like chemotaxis protein
MTYQRFILIDDNEADNVYHEIMIRRAGFQGEILVFESGVDALTFFMEDHLSVPTCIFLDINMPMMDGFEMAEQATPLLIDKPSVVLLMLTSSGSPADRERAGTLPIIKGYVTKPLDVATVQDLMAAGA